MSLEVARKYLLMMMKRIQRGVVGMNTQGLTAPATNTIPRMVKEH